MHLWPHGIMVCTIGSLPKTLKKFPQLRDTVFDLVLDECGQVWENDCMLFLPQLKVMMRFALFGDPKQMTPYVTKLMKKGQYFPAVCSVLPSMERGSLCSPFTLFHERLRIQYRTLPEMCDVHAPIFYTYPVESHRQTPNNPVHDGLYYERLPFGWELDRQTLEQYEVQRALEIYVTIRDKELKTSDGTAYSMIILTPYLKQLDMLYEGAAGQRIEGFRATTYDSVQGCEYNVVIVTTGRSKMCDLNQCRFRGNVATSRAKDMMILMVHSDMALASRNGATRFWGQFILRARPYSRCDAGGLRVRAKLALHHSRTNRDGKIDNDMEALHMLVNQPGCPYRYPKDTITAALCLHKKPSQNTTEEERVFCLLVRCPRPILRKAWVVCLKCGANTIARCEQLAKLLRRYSALTDVTIALLVKGAYKRY